MDIALDGKIAMVEAVDQNVENQVHFALLVEDDPSSRPRLAAPISSSFFYSADEVESLSPPT